MSYDSVSGDPNYGRDYEADARAEVERYRVEQENDARLADAAAARAAQPPHPLATSAFPDPNRRLFGGRKSRQSRQSRRSKRSKRTKRTRRR